MRTRSATYTDRETAQWATELDYTTGLAELGLEVEPPTPLSTVGWLVELARAVDRH